MLNNKRVNLFIVGAAKAGTTTLYNHLAFHPEICMSRIKEPNYFTAEPLQKDQLYYNETIISSKEGYENLFNPFPGQHLIGEASVSYLFYPGTARKIFEYNPDSRIIILIRNPVSRAFSHYLMDKKLGLVKNSFDQIIKAGNPPEIYAKYFQQYITYGLYSRQVKEYLGVFPQSQVLIILFDEFQKYFSAVLDKITIFLQLKTELLSLNGNIFNEAATPREGLISFLYQKRFTRKFFKAIIPESLSDKIKRLFFISPTGHLTDEQKEWLKNYYRNDIRELEKLLQKNLSSWYE